MTKGMFEVFLNNREVRVNDHNGVRVIEMSRDLQAAISDAGVMADSELPRQVDNWAATRQLRANQVGNSIYHYRLERR
jgi:hypothetical protein